MDRLLDWGLRVELRVYVDDLCLQFVGTQRDVVERTAEAADVVATLLGGVSLEASVGRPGKPGRQSFVLCSSPWLERALRRRMARRGIAVTRAAVYMGVDMGTGGGRRAKQRERQAAAARKTRWLRVLGAPRRGRKKILRSSVKAGILYGVASHGMPDAKLAELRRAAGHCLGFRPSGGYASLTLLLALEKDEPAGAVAAAPLRAWAAAVWERPDMHGYMEQAWRRRCVELQAKPQWRKVRGPAGATFMTLRRLGWSWPAWHAFRTREGVVLDLRETCPMDVGLAAKNAAELQVWRAWVAKPGRARLAPRPFLEPVRAQLAAKSAEWTPRLRNAARQLVIGGSWTQARLQEIAAVDSPLCQA